MKKKVNFVAALFLCSTVLLAQNNKEAKPIVNVKPVSQEVKPAAPVNTSTALIKFEVEQHDFGTIPEGPQAKFDFVFTNTGKEPLILTDVHASCGCTTPVWPKEPIMPGAKSKITAVYNTKGRPGNFTKSITIKSNSKDGDKMVIIKGTVEKAPTTAAPEKAPNVINEMPVKN